MDKRFLDNHLALRNSPCCNRRCLMCSYCAALIQEMVISLVSDKAIWDALLKNEKVVEFRELLHKGQHYSVLTYCPAV
jgi:hypothetical protein